MEKIKTPVVLIVFNRPDATSRIINEISKVKPPKLLIIADGPRIFNPGDADNCRKVREIVKNSIDWECEVLTNYLDENLGCKMRVSTGLDWAFSLVEEAIILEDDCIPEISFFRFCEELLEKYRNNEKVAIISGSNLFVSFEKNPHSYFFSNFPQAWGWATWRRFWNGYDVGIKKWAELKNTDWLEKVLNGKGVCYDYWNNVFDQTYQNKTSTWDYQLVFAAWAEKALAAIPTRNLVSNIGSGINRGAHIKKRHKFGNMKTFPMQFPMKIPDDIVANKKADTFIGKYNFTYFRPFLVKAFLYLCLKLKRLIVGL